MYSNLILAHQVFATIFFIYILLDRLYIRIYLPLDKRKTFYNKSKIPMLIISIVLALSGIYILINNNFNQLLVLKSSLAFLLIFSFFYCPFFMKKCDSSIKRFLYRYLVVGLLLSVCFLGLYI